MSTFEYVLQGIIRNDIFLGNNISNKDHSVPILYPSPENSKTHIAIPDIVALLSKKAGIVKNNDQT